MNYIIVTAILLITLGLVSQRSKGLLHMLQLEEYKSDNYRKWINSNKERAYGFNQSNQPVKKPLVFTKRATRLYIANLVISGLILLVPSLVYIFFNKLI